MTPEELGTLIHEILKQLIEDGKLNLSADQLPEVVKVERPRQRNNGDWATNIAMQLAKKAGLAPRELATLITDKLAGEEAIEKTEIAGPGFVNLWISSASAAGLVTQILEAGSAYGTSQELAEKTFNVEFVSANPTGPIHLGGARWAAVGDTLCRILEANGAKVIREYYFNDHGAQIDRFAASLLARAKGEEVPADGYGGDYIDDIAQRVVAKAKEAGTDVLALPESETLEYFREHGTGLMFEDIKQQLGEFGVQFDVYFHEDSLHSSGAVERAIDQLRQRGAIYDQDGAVWLASSKYGDDKDRVVIKSDGEAAYFAGDVAYYLDKKERGATNEILILGADHHGYIGRMYAMCQAFGGVPGENLEIIIGQMVNLLENGEPVRMSKRAGTVITLNDLVEAVGNDAARYALARVSMDSTVDIDLAVLRSRTNENPVYYVQYAHARTCNVSRNAQAAGVTRELPFQPELLNTPADSDLLGILAQYPAEIKLAGQGREQHRIARYIERLAAGYHTWYNQCRVTPRAGEDVEPVHAARLYLNDAVRQVLANGLEICGVSAPERM